VVVGRERGRLQDEDIRAADVFLDFDEDLHVGETPDYGLGQLALEVGGDRRGQPGVGVAGDELDRSILGRHARLLQPHPLADGR
jgi:hypothetical protein